MLDWMPSRAGGKHGRQQGEAGRSRSGADCPHRDIRSRLLVEEVQGQPGQAEYAVKKVGHSARKVEEYIKLQKHRAADKSRIALSEPYEVRYWSKKFKITPAKLRLVVGAAGHSSKKVEAYLAAQKAANKKTARKTTKKTTKKATTRKKAA
ncbi:hypothetical protein ACVWY3_007129 [Bradyrhizobium sp. USDA 4486]